MLGKEIIDDERMEYYIWLISFIDCDLYPVNEYDKVLWKLMTTKFVVSMDRDQNRVDDALDLRKKFIPWDWGETLQVSILEIMVSMAIRIEDQIMKNTSDDDRTSVWFWDMMQSLGLRQEFDSMYDGDAYVDRILHDFNNRKYDKNGLGGLFVTRDPSKNMRKMELWFQMHAYLNDVLQDEGLLRKER